LGPVRSGFGFLLGVILGPVRSGVGVLLGRSYNEWFWGLVRNGCEVLLGVVLEPSGLALGSCYDGFRFLLGEHS
jgi:hypothetical protein